MRGHQSEGSGRIFSSMQPTSSRPHLFGLLAGLFLATGISFASIIMARAWTRIHETQLIEVTGSARKNVRADLVIWRASFAVEAPTLLEAQQNLKSDRARIDAWLAGKDVKEVSALPVQIKDINVQRFEQTTTQQTTSEKRIGYKLTQTLIVRSPDVERIPRLASDATELIEQANDLIVSPETKTNVLTQARIEHAMLMLSELNLAAAGKWAATFGPSLGVEPDPWIEN